MDDSRGPTVMAVAIAFAVIAVVTILLRLWSRIFVVKTFGWDDGLICVAVLLSWAFIGCTMASVQHGLGDHIDVVMARGPDNMTTYSQIVWLSSIFYNACLGFIKFSVLALYMRLGDRTLRRMAICVMVVVFCQAGGNVMACIFQCTPVRAAYDVTIPLDEKKCVNINAFYLANAAVNILTDIMTYTLPFPVISRLQVPTKQKAGVAVMVCLGLLACISSIVRITYVPSMLHADDFTYVISDAMYWSVIEINIGILAASIPSFKALFTRYAPGVLSSRSKTGTGGSGFKMVRGDTSRGDRGWVDRTGDHKTQVQTSVQTGIDPNSSEEHLWNVPGRIGVSTSVVHQSEEAIKGKDV